MLKKPICLCIISTYILIISMSFAASDLPYNEGEILVRFVPDVDNKSMKIAHRNSILSSVNIGQIQRTLKSTPDLSLVKLNEGISVSDAIKSLKGKNGILRAQPNFIYKACVSLPDDTRFSELWGIHNTGQSGGTSNADINAPQAWESITDSETIVAVIDTGVDYEHSDLAENIWVNEAELRGIQDVDDDGNGYIDDVYGYDFCNNRADPMDDAGHGTHCAGTIAAVGNNGLGITGVCWRVKIMAVKAGNNSGGGLMCGYLINSRNNAKALFGFKPQAFAQAINSIISTRLLAVSQLCI